MQSKKVFQVLLLGLAGTLLVYNAFAQSLLPCPLATQLFYRTFGHRHVVGGAVFEGLNAGCGDIIVEERSGRVLLALDTRIVQADGSVSLINAPAHSLWDPFNGGYVSLGSKFNIFVEARYTLWGLGWQIDSFDFRGGRPVP